MPDPILLDLLDLPGFPEPIDHAAFIARLGMDPDAAFEAGLEQVGVITGLRIARLAASPAVHEERK